MRRKRSPAEIARLVNAGERAAEHYYGKMRRGLSPDEIRSSSEYLYVHWTSPPFRAEHFATGFRLRAYWLANPPGEGGMVQGRLF